MRVRWSVSARVSRPTLAGMLPLEHAAHPFARFCGELRLVLVIINTPPRVAGAVEQLIAETRVLRCGVDMRVSWCNT